MCALVEIFVIFINKILLFHNKEAVLIRVGHPLYDRSWQIPTLHGHLKPLPACEKSTQKPG